MERDFHYFSHQSKKSIQFAYPPSERFLDLMKDGTLKKVADSQMKGGSLTLEQLMYPEREESNKLVHKPYEKSHKAKARSPESN